MPDPSDRSSGFEPDPSADPRIEGTLTQVRVIAGALAASVLIYGLLAWLVTSRTAGEPIGLPTMAVLVLAALGVLDLVLAPFIERALLAGAGRRPGQPGPSTERALAEYRKAKLVGFAFREAAAIFGLLIALFTRQPAWCYALAAATLVAMALAWPSRGELERVTRGATEPR